MTKLNILQYSTLDNLSISNDFSLSALSTNDSFEKCCFEYKERYGYKKIKTFSFSKEGFLALFLELDETIAVSKGESEAVVEGAKLYERIGGKIVWLGLNKEGLVDFTALQTQSLKLVFVSSYVMDTFVKTDLSELKQYENLKIISNASACVDTRSDIIYFDNYKLTGFNSSGVLLFNKEEFELLPIGTIDTISVKICLDALKAQEFNTELKHLFIEKLQRDLGDDIFFFVEPALTLDYSLHFGLRGIRAREFIRTLALSKIYITNGEGCSLGLSRPSRIIQEMGYGEDKSRESISLSFCEELRDEKVEEIVNMIVKKYKQIKLLNS